MGKPRELKTKGIVLHKLPFRETSYIAEMFSPDLGKFSVMVKGIRQEKNPNFGIIDLLNELETVLYKNPSSEWFIFKSGELLKSHLREQEFRRSLFMQAAAEVMLQLIISEEDAAELYKLLINYLDFLGTISKQEEIVFWRFMLKMYKILGVELEVKKCVLCGGIANFPQAYFPRKNGFICENCSRPHLEKEVIKLDEQAAKIIGKIYRTNEIFNKIEISKKTLFLINRIFLIHLDEHFHKNFHLKSLEMVV